MTGNIQVDIKKRYSGQKQAPDFNLDVNFTASNELVVLFGRSGSGKTTTLRCIAGLGKPDRGFIDVNGKVYFDSGSKKNLSPQDRRPGYVFQNYALFPHMSVAKNITYGLKGKSDAAKEQRLHEMLELLHITGLQDQYPSRLSGGQKQRVALARALAPNPDILLLDEPFSALDMVVRMRLRERIHSIQETLDIPVLFITHNPVEAFTLADKVVVLHEGSVQQEGRPEDVFYNPCNRHVAEIVGVSNIFDADFAGKSENGFVLDTDSISITTTTNVDAAGSYSWGVRPENVHLHPAREDICGCNVFSTNVRSVVNRGASRVVAVDIPDGRSVLLSEMDNRTFGKLDIGPGSECLVEIDPRDVLVFVREEPAD
ncbi:ABC transporter ATP-binding protein [Methanohalophilus sp. RSK]|uniref:ABC transporter ATP-binding protein n=1 Tax=Methanohalophilus sp. RSK TaxID=2485783 RepID=UPI000F43C90A|nr:ABC transporter ATP-binding protein [Methanohalophilus sp. RSK]RNI14052.1 ABC transporter ATP-binding protein [Methanohalophilus sp. RSK]